MNLYWKVRASLCISLLVTAVPASIASARPQPLVKSIHLLNPDLEQAIMNAKAELRIPDRDENGDITHTFAYNDPEDGHSVGVTITVGEPVLNRDGIYEMSILLEEGDELITGTVEAWAENGRIYVQPNMDYPEGDPDSVRHNGNHCKSADGSGGSCGCRGGRDGLLELQIVTSSGSHAVVRDGGLVDLGGRAVMCYVAIMILVFVIVAVGCVWLGFCKFHLPKFRRFIEGDQPCLV